MRRALPALVLAALITAFYAAPASAIPVKVVNRINAIGLIDYSARPTFKVGDYARYKVVNGGGGADPKEYVLTILIAGEEEFWGERCFWVETWNDDPGGRGEAAGSLISYAIFDDSLANERVQLYRRKLVAGAEETGEPAEELTRGTSNLNSLRSAPIRPMGYKSDTLGADTVQTPMGLLQARKVQVEQGKSLTQTQTDSTVYQETREKHLRWLTNEVPLTHVAREDAYNTEGRRAWKLGYSSEASPLLTRETGYTFSRLIEYGHDGVSRLLPPERRMSIEQARARAKAAASTARKTPVRRTTPKR